MPELSARKPRPIWYNLSLLNLPVPGLVSIFHRISGVLLAIAIAGMLYFLDGSLKSEADFAQVRSELSHPIVKLMALGILWAFSHHLFAGIRYLFLDLGKGIGLPAARATGFVVFGVSGLLTLVLGAKLW